MHIHALHLCTAFHVLVRCGGCRAKLWGCRVTCSNNPIGCSPHLASTVMKVVCTYMWCISNTKFKCLRGVEG